MSIAVVAFLCAVSIPHAECGRDTAIDVLTFPPAQSELTCLRDSMQTLADLAIQPREGERWVVKCTRTEIGRESVG
jgi:hypothetical protein